MSSPRRQPTLNYYPAEYASPCSSPNACGNKSCEGNGAVVVASIVLIILLLFVVIGGACYWNYTPTAEVDVIRKKQVSFADSTKPKQLQECPEKLILSIMQGPSEPVILAFVAPWCGHCQHLKPILEEAAKESNLPIYTLTQIDNQKTPLVGKVAEHLNVKGFPMIFRIEDGKAIPYNGDRSKNSIVEFAK
jgi:thiol-disulfide isomerase/thioredoxin